MSIVDGHRQTMADLAEVARCTEVEGCPASLHVVGCPADDTVPPKVTPIRGT